MSFVRLAALAAPLAAPLLTPASGLLSVSMCPGCGIALVSWKREEMPYQQDALYMC